MQLLIRIPDELGERFKASVPARSRSAFLKRLIESALPKETDPLYLTALAVEQDQELNEDMALWEVAGGDGIGSQS